MRAEHIWSSDARRNQKKTYIYLNKQKERKHEEAANWHLEGKFGRSFPPSSQASSRLNKNNKILAYRQNWQLRSCISLGSEPFLTVADRKHTLEC